jgi:hypothetical protein
MTVTIECEYCGDAIAVTSPYCPKQICYEQALADEHHRAKKRKQLDRLRDEAPYGTKHANQGRPEEQNR